MSRSKWKGPYFDSKITNLIKKTYNKNIKVSRNSEILPAFVDLTFDVHNGKKHNSLKITKEMVGHKFGEFCFTRTKFMQKKK